MSIRQIKVLVADDSPTARAHLVQIVNSDPGLSVVGEATNGKQAIKMTAALHPEVILMDIFMPDMDGFEATREIMHHTPTPIVMVSGSVDKRESSLAMQAISNGALTAIRKPPASRDPNYQAEVKELLNTVRSMADVHVIHHFKPEPLKPLVHPAPAMTEVYATVSPKLVAIVSSTGGPTALCEILRGLSGDFPLPVAIVQHISSDFIPSLVSWLDSITPLAVKVAMHGELPQPGTVYVAPGGTHLRITKRLRFDLNGSPEAVPHIPSGDVFLESVAQAYGSQAIGLVLTGMGEDGARGLRAMYDKGALTLAQDEATSVVYGMPRQAKEIGAVRQVLPLPQIASFLTELIIAGNR